MFVYMCVALLFDCVHCKTKNEEKSEKLNAIIKKLEKGIKFNQKKFLISFLLMIERWDYHCSIDYFKLYMPTKSGYNGLLYL